MDSLASIWVKSFAPFSILCDLELISPKSKLTISGDMCLKRNEALHYHRECRTCLSQCVRTLVSLCSKMEKKKKHDNQDRPSY